MWYSIHIDQQRLRSLIELNVVTTAKEKIMPKKTIVGWNPTLLTDNKLIHIDNIIVDTENEEKGQARLTSIDVSHVQALEHSIRANGLLNPIEIEVIEWGGAFDDSFFRIRDGNHRLAAEKSRLLKLIGTQARVVACRVYEKNTDSNADLQWAAWQHQRNVHADKVCLPNSLKDSAAFLSKVLYSGELPEAYAACQRGDWDGPDIEDGLRKYMKKDPSFKTVTLSERDKLIEIVYDLKKKIYHHKIKRYAPAEIKDILKLKLKHDTRTGQPCKNAAQIVRIANNDDWDKQILAFYRSMANGDHQAGMKNILVFHSKEVDVTRIRKKREKVVEFVKEHNEWYQGVTNTKLRVIDKVYCLGQLLKLPNPKHNEKVNQLISLPIN